MEGQVDRPAGEGDRARLDPLARRDEEAAVGLAAHPDRRQPRHARDQGREREQAQDCERSFRGRHAVNLGRTSAFVGETIPDSRFPTRG